jgi:hypothetical protein
MGTRVTTRPACVVCGTSRRLLRLLDDHETTIADAQQTVDALETWKRWATGHSVTLEQLVDAVDVLHSDRADHSALAAPLATWMDQHHFAPGPAHEVSPGVVHPFVSMTPPIPSGTSAPFSDS